MAAPVTLEIITIPLLHNTPDGFLLVNRVVFNIKGNDYRLIVVVHYNRGMMYIRFVGTQAD